MNEKERELREQLAVTEEQITSLQAVKRHVDQHLFEATALRVKLYHRLGEVVIEQMESSLEN